MHESNHQRVVEFRGGIVYRCSRDKRILGGCGGGRGEPNQRDGNGNQ